MSFNTRMPAFDPEGEGYDMNTARQYGFTPDETGHWATRAQLPIGEARRLGLPDDAGLILKGRRHETWSKSEQADAELGYRTRKVGNRYYSVKD